MENTRECSNIDRAELVTGHHFPCKSKIFLLLFYVSEVAEFLDNIQTKVLQVCLVAIQSHFYSFVLRFIFLQTHATSHSFYSLVTVHCKGERRKT